MKEKTKEFLKKYLIGFIFGVVCAEAVIVYAQTYFPSNDVIYDNTKSGLSSTNVQGAIDELYGVCFPPKTGGDAILDKEPIVDTGDGLYEDEYEKGKHTYKGSDPNNYVYFNCTDINNQNSSTCEIWRIISINADKTIKIMRDESIGNIQWDSNNSLDWKKPASLNTYLNSTYYNDYLVSSAHIQIIEDATYSIGGVVWRNTNIQSQIDSENRTKWSGKVALATLSEYLRAGSNTNCKTFLDVWNDYEICKNSNWMVKSNITWWTLSSASLPSDGVFRVGSNGSIGSNVYVSYGVRPVVNLSSGIKITEGNGSQNNPYKLSL